LLALVGLLLVGNHRWLFPQEGVRQYTYERAEITVEDGTLRYDGAFEPYFDHGNDLDAVDCQAIDDWSRSCGFDAHLVADGPVTVPTEGESWRSSAPSAAVRDGYYRRVLEGNETARTYDVERVEPRALLADVAYDAADLGPANLSDATPLESGVAVTGEPRTTKDRLGDDRLGGVYRRNGTYYTVVPTDASRVDRGLPLSSGTRGLPGVLGVLASVLGGLVVLSETVREE
jgi:hypothetical protein